MEVFHPIALFVWCSHHGLLAQEPEIMKKTILFPALALAFGALAFVLVSEWTTAQEPAPSAASTGPDVVAVITTDPNLTTLVSALRAAELIETLHGRGPYTLFAPNNAAFAKLPAGTLANLMMPENKTKLAAILKNHAIRGKVAAADVSGGKKRTLGGGKVEVAKGEGKVFFGKATVLMADREASNGVVHVIDTVIMPD
jgi:uncharacterized surface protein with fasciclin (FAS1) repeats